MFKLNFKTNNQKGSVILFTLLILGSMLAITLSLLAIYVPKISEIRQAGSDSAISIYAADSAIEWCLYQYRGNVPTLPQPTLSNSATYTINGSCDPSNQALNVQTVGTYQNVSRSLQVNTQ